MCTAIKVWKGGRIDGARQVEEMAGEDPVAHAEEVEAALVAVDGIHSGSLVRKSHLTRKVWLTKTDRLVKTSGFMTCPLKSHAFFN